MKIMQKLVMGFVVVSLLVGFVGAIGLYTTNHITSYFERGEEHFGSIVMASTEVSSYAKRAEGHVMLYITLHDEADRQKFFMRLDSLRNQTAIIDREAENPEARKILDEIKSGTADLQAAGESLISMHDIESETGGFRPENHADLIRNLNNYASRIRESGVKMAELETRLKAGQEKSAKETAGYLYNVIFLISAISVFAALVLGYTIAKSITSPIAILKKAIANISKGNFGTRIDIKTKDEISEIGASLGIMAAKLSESRDELKNYSRRLEEKVAEKTKELKKSKSVLEDRSKRLEGEVAERVKEIEKSKKKLEEKLSELEKFNKLGVGRELKMIELKKRIGELERQLKK